MFVAEDKVAVGDRRLPVRRSSTQLVAHIVLRPDHSVLMQCECAGRDNFFSATATLRYATLSPVLRQHLAYLSHARRLHTLDLFQLLAVLVHDRSGVFASADGLLLRDQHFPLKVCSSQPDGY